MTIILVTHEVDISEYAKRVLLFRDGKIVKDYPVTERRNAAEALRQLPVDEDEEDDETG
jgi:putative ABC transport system ATP-binding protein